MNSTVRTIEANPDVSGVGLPTLNKRSPQLNHRPQIRISIYAFCLGGSMVNNLLSVFASGEDQEEFSRGVSSALGFQGLALLCTAIYQTVQGELTLFHAICVVHLLAILGMDMVRKGRYSGLGPWRLYFFSAIQVLALAAFLALNVYVWVTAPQFGSQPQCNKNTAYMVFGVSIKATSPVFRYIILGTFGAIVAGYVPTFTCMLPRRCGYVVYRRRHPDAGNRTEGQKRGWVNWLVQVNHPVYQDRREPPERLHGQALLNFTLNKVAYCSFCIYLIVSLEQTIHRNNFGPEEKMSPTSCLMFFLRVGIGGKLKVLSSWCSLRRARATRCIPYLLDICMSIAITTLR
ncbi:hypothetical protein N7519_000611 [Penicillium mononematosum]|uniref:uncharacterized protein n=1 Tax=Penicillium mononematosum TaxID=268346 RepID=UPI002547DB4F|nr:uncharacterized protein N7519_000611 [Penicillium mononematosum]KAJ6190590.1 hypothetical protein N7519_000611 [Penicillium mononematosum]